jgi:DNA-binding CsgD family transcriptional regulator
VIRPIESPEARQANGAAKAVIFISDPDQGLRASRLRLLQLFELTPAEANLVALLAAGHDLSEAADVLRITKESARTYLKHAFEKTGTHRQAELVHLALAAATAGAVEA